MGDGNHPNGPWALREIDCPPPACRMRDGHGLVHYAMHEQSTLSTCYMVNVAWAIRLDGVVLDAPLTCLRCATMVFRG